MKAELRPPPAGSAPSPLGDFGTEFPQFDLVKFLGRGRAGTLWQVRHRKLGHAFALRVLAFPSESERETFASRFESVARALVEFAHPAAVAVHDFGIVPSGHPWLLADFVEGADLGKLCGQHRDAVPTAFRASLAAAFADALWCARRQGIDDDGLLCDLILDRRADLRVAGLGLSLLCRGADAAWPPGSPRPAPGGSSDGHAEM